MESQHLKYFTRNLSVSNQMNNRLLQFFLSQSQKYDQTTRKKNKKMEFLSSFPYLAVHLCWLTVNELTDRGGRDQVPKLQ